MNIIERSLADYLAREGRQSDPFAADERALPLCPDWLGTVFLTVTGRFLYRDEEQKPPQVRQETEAATQLMALIHGVTRFPLLVNLLPKRPFVGETCERCQGSGTLQLANRAQIPCVECYGLGWLATIDPALPLPEIALEKAAYPRFDIAAAKFADFARKQGFPEPMFPSDARERYERAARQRRGVRLDGNALGDGRLAVSVLAPQSMQEAMERLYPDALVLALPATGAPFPQTA
jgi:hypothetical protein